MAIDFNTVDEQHEGSYSPIPPKSKVRVQLNIKYPSAGWEGAAAPELTKSKTSSMEYLGTTLTVMGGTFNGKKIFCNFSLAGAQTPKQHTAVNISMSRIRAMLECARNVHPKDNSPQAAEARRINSWNDLEGMQFFAEVDCRESLPDNKGKTYINNELSKVVTMEDADYLVLVQQGEIITDEPIPEVKGSANARTGSSASEGTSARTGAPAWGAQAAPQSAAQTQQQAGGAQQSSAAPTPAWAAPAAPQATTPPPAPQQTPPPPPMQTFPSEAGGIDPVPF